jgi:hypothetical protein
MNFLLKIGVYMNIIFTIFPMALTMYILYLVIETAVQNGIDSSKTNEMLKEMKELLQEKRKEQ